MTTSLSLTSERVLNGDSDYFNSNAAKIFLLDGYPDLLHLDYAKAEVFTMRDGKEYTIEEIKLPKTLSHIMNKEQCDGANLFVLVPNLREGVIVKRSKELFQTIELRFPANRVNAFYKVFHTFYFVNWTESEYQLFDINKPEQPLFSFPRAESCVVGGFFVTLSYEPNSMSISLHPLNGDNPFVCLHTFDIAFAFGAFTQIQDHWLIVVGRSQIAVIDVQTKQSHTFSCHDFTGSVTAVAARLTENVIEIFVSSNLSRQVCQIHKVSLPVELLTQQPEDQEPVEIKTVDLKDKDSEAKATIARLEKAAKEQEEKAAALEAKVKELEEKLAILQ